jgi:hypothetical protein
MRSVAAPVCADVAVNLIVRGELTDLKSAIGKDETEEEPTVYVEEVQEDMRESDGCMRSWEAAFRKPVGLDDGGWGVSLGGVCRRSGGNEGRSYCPSQVPILKIVVPVLTEPEIDLLVVEPAVTVTELVATGYSPW